jgi:hypothetical protein
MSQFTNEVNIANSPIDVNVTNASPIAVSGTITATPSGTQDVNLVSTISVPVTGTFFQATQPVSGSISVSNFPATQPVSIASPVAVTGTFYQATQPVSGTFWQATQPVSIAASVAVTGPLTDTQLRATPVPVSVASVGTGTATVSRVSVTNTAATTLSASNSAKSRVILYNEGGTLYVKFGSTASNTDYTYTLTANSTLEIDGYYGIITARKNSGTTFVQVTEVGI